MNPRIQSHMAWRSEEEEGEEEEQACSTCMQHVFGHVLCRMQNIKGNLINVKDFH